MRSILLDQALKEPRPMGRPTPKKDLDRTRILVVMPSIALFGMERANLQIMKMMRERGAEVLFVTEHRYGDRLRRAIDEIGCRWSGDAVVAYSYEIRLHLPKNIRDMVSVFGVWLRAAWKIYRTFRDFKPTHIYLTNLTYALLALPVLWVERCGVLFRLANPPNVHLIGLRQKLMKWIWRYGIWPSCDLFICNSRYAAGILEDLGISRQRVRVLYNTVPMRRPDPVSDAPKLEPGNFHVVYVGQIRPDKGVLELIEAAERVAREYEEVHFIIVGDYLWRNEFARTLMQEVERKQLTSRIHFLGERKDIFGILRQCEVHVCSSKSPEESFPNVLLEAKACSLPSVVFPTGGILEGVEHLVDGFVCRDQTSEALYEGIRYFLDRPRALGFSRHAARRSLERFSEEKISDQWAEVLKRRP